MNEKVESLINTGSFWFPKSASVVSDRVDLLFNVIAIGSTILFVLICFFMVYFIVRYRRTGPRANAKSPVVHHTGLELAWTIIPLILVMIIFVWGYRDYLKLMVSPEKTLEIRVTGKQWLWQFDYTKEGVTTLTEMVVPVGKPVSLIMSSEDVIHSFFIPNFRLKRDVIPNRYTKIWFQSDDLGTYQIFCTEFCGDGHSEMLGTLRVVSEADYESWLKGGSDDAQKDIPLAELGEKLFVSKACNTCHSLDGSKKTGPSWQGLYGSTRELTIGEPVTADNNYLRESIVNPAAKVVKGFAPVMPTYSGLLSDREMNAIIEFIKKVK
jgi:cytochrome c oxidase subunit 2